MKTGELKESETEDGEIDDSIDDSKDDNLIINCKYGKRQKFENQNSTSDYVEYYLDNHEKKHKKANSYFDCYEGIYSNETSEENCQSYFTGYISSIVASQSVPKNITISQFKKYTEISNQSEIMNIVTEAVKQSGNPGTRKSDTLSDNDVLELIPQSNLVGMFNLEKQQLIKLLRHSVDRGLLTSKNISSSKNHLKRKSVSPLKVESHAKKCIKLPNQGILDSPISCSGSSSKTNVSDSDNSESVNDSDNSDDILPDDDYLVMKARKLEQERLKNQTNPKPMNIIQKLESIHTIATKLNDVSNCDKSHNHKNSPSESSSVLSSLSKSLSTSTDCNKTKYPSQNPSIVNSPSIKIEHIANTDVTPFLCQSVQSPNEISSLLHNIYAKMYDASVKMKECEPESNEHQVAYVNYCDHYNEYQRIYTVYQTSLDFDNIQSKQITDSSTNKNVNLSNNLSTKPDENQDSSTNNNNNNNSSPTSPNYQNIDASNTLEPTTFANELNNEENIVKNYTEEKVTSSSIPPENVNKKEFGYLWLSNLSCKTKAVDLCKLFCKYGNIVKVKVFEYKVGKDTSYFALVCLSKIVDAEEALKQLQNQILFDKIINMKKIRQIDC